MKTYKRQFRELPDETKKKIQASTRGKMKSTAHRQHISQALKKYWANIPHRPNDEHISMDDLIGVNKNNKK